jgi:hypothetical protein
MNPSNQPGEDQGFTTALHVNKFVPTPREQPPPAPNAEDTATIVIKKVAAQVAATETEPVTVPKGGGNALPATEMLGVVAYAYAKGVYRSEDIERRLVQEPELRRTLGNEIPDAATIRRFRRLNRGAIVRTLEAFYRWARRKPAPPRGEAPQAPAPPARTGFAEADSTVILAHRAAEDRVEKAMFTDNMAKEQD